MIALLSPLTEPVTGWLASEKFDGVRAIWDGEDFVSRNGKVFKAPDWFKAGMPNVRIDGELWMGHGTFNALQSTLQRKGSDWHGVFFMAFETCDMAEPVEARIAALAGLALPSHVVPVEHIQLRSQDHLDAMEREIVDNGGEGVVIRRPGSKYRPGRAGDVVKVKRLVSDEDRWWG